MGQIEMINGDIFDVMESMNDLADNIDLAPNNRTVEVEKVIPPIGWESEVMETTYIKMRLIISNIVSITD